MDPSGKRKLNQELSGIVIAGTKQGRGNERRKYGESQLELGISSEVRWKSSAVESSWDILGEPYQGIQLSSVTRESF